MSCVSCGSIITQVAYVHRKVVLLWFPIGILVQWNPSQYQEDSCQPE